MNLFKVYPLFNITPVKAKDVFIYDKNETEYLDLYGGHAVISIGHSHPNYVNALQKQVGNLGFYSNSMVNPLQETLATTLGEQSGCEDYKLFLCNSGAEANENALKLASFHNQKKKVIAFTNGFHGRTSAAVASTDNAKITAPINAQQEVIFIALGDIVAVEKTMQQGGVCAVIIEFIQGVGGLDEASTYFYKQLRALCTQHNVVLIADEVQSGFGRTGDFFAFQKYDLKPDIIAMAKGMGNGFPVGGILIGPQFKATHGLLGTTFGGNHLACAASIAVLEVLQQEELLKNVQKLETYFKKKAKELPQILQVKGRGLMLGLEFDFPIAVLRKKLIFDYQIITGNAKNPNILRVLPPLTLKETHVDTLFNALTKILKDEAFH